MPEVTQDTRIDLPATGAEASIAELLANWVTIVRTRIRTTVELAAAEVKLAAMSFVLMNVFAVALAILALSGWGLLLAGMVVGLLSAGISLWIILVSAAVLHLALAYVLWRSIVRLSAHLNLTATQPEPADAQPAPGPNHAD